ncbi:MAG: glycosyltransferase, partial [Bacteroidales bacterium]|nr:glycosyltransferase [Bacteroidales bacterium]
IIFFYQGWRKLKNPVKEKDIYSDKVKVAVIIPARNEETNIVNLLNDLDSQNYPEPWIEVIVADDASGDGTAQAVREWADTHSLNVKLLNLEEPPDNPSPKKRALSQAINHSTADLIITTDADCRVGEDWISAIVQHYEATGAKMISGPVRLTSLTNFFSKLQALEFLSLVGSGAGSVAKGKPLMANGANLAFSKKAFEKVGGYQGNEMQASGDDVFLMLKMNEFFKENSVSFLKDEKAIVDTSPKSNWKEFISQRIRWASKAKAYKNFFSIFSSWVVFVFCIAIIIATIGLVFGEFNPGMVIFMWAVKLVVDFIFLWKLTRFMKQNDLMWYYFPAQLFVIGYTTIAGFLGSLGGFSWKGRRYG